MPASPDNRRLVTYVPVAQAEEIARRVHADGRTVSGWLARVIADALGDLVDQVAPPAPPPSRPAPLVAPPPSIPPLVAPPPSIPSRHRLASHS